MKARKKPRRNRVASDDGLERTQYTLWTNPMHNWWRGFDHIKITPEIEAAVVKALSKVDTKEIDKRTKAFRGNSYFPYRAF